MTESFVEAIEDSEGGPFNKYLSVRNLVTVSAIGVLLLVSASSVYFYQQNVKTLEEKDKDLARLNETKSFQEKELKALRDRDNVEQERLYRIKIKPIRENLHKVIRQKKFVLWDRKTRQ